MPNNRVLLVEDNVFCRLEIADALRCHGFNILEAASVIEAVEIIKSDGLLLALVTDIDLGLGANGYDVARCGRAAHPHLAVVYISASDQNRHPIEGVAGSEFVGKPFLSEQVALALDRVISLEAA